MLNDEDPVELDTYDFATEQDDLIYFTGPDKEGGVRVGIRAEDDGEDVSIYLSAGDRRTLISVLDMADDEGPWSREWHTRYRGSDIRSACLLFIQAIRNWAVSELRFANSMRTESTSWTSIFNHRRP